MIDPLILFRTPEVNPITKKARSIPVFNVFNMHGRVFFFSWFGFFVAFWSWYAFPPLLHDTIQKDLHLTKVDVANSNIIALCATLLVRWIAGPFCDKFGARSTFAGCLIIGAIPTFLAGTCHTKAQLFACRFFIGILGGSFVPCQVWSTGFFDKNVVGTANALIAGWGNAGGGVTYFLMPSIYDSLVENQHLTPHTAWRVAFVVPGIVILAVAAGLFFLCEDLPTGKWSNRHIAAKRNLVANGISATLVEAPGPIIDKEFLNRSKLGTPTGSDNTQVDEDWNIEVAKLSEYHEPTTSQRLLDTARGEIVLTPTFETIKVVYQPQTLVLAFCYFCSFGTELAVNSILGNYYQKNFKSLGQTSSGRWAAMFGLLNIVTRPAGGIISDLLYSKTNSIWVKKIWMHSLGFITSAFLIAIGLTDSHSRSTMFGLVAGFALFLEACNGANFSLVPHVNPQANGVVSGIAGGTGNLGGVIFSIIFRYQGTDYAKSFWIIGVIFMAINVVCLPVPPLAKHQIGGR